MQFDQVKNEQSSMKVLLVNSFYYPHMVGGAERSVRLLAEALHGQGLDVVVVTLSPERQTKITTVDGIKVYYIGFTNIYKQFSGHRPLLPEKLLFHVINTYDPRMKRRVDEVIAKEQPDVVNTHNLGGISAAVWHATKRRNLPLVHTLRYYYVICRRDLLFRRGSNCLGTCMECRPFLWIRRRLSQLPDAAIGISRFILEQHIERGCFSNADVRAVIHNPVANGISTASTCNSKKSRLRFGYLGRLNQTKGVEDFLSCIQKLPSEECEVEIAGRGDPYYENVLKSKFQMPNVTFTGYVNPDEFLPRIDVLVVPSRWHEPFGRAVIEAYAYGIPVIATNQGGLPEIVDDGTTGIVYDPENPESLRRALKYFIQNQELAKEMKKYCLIKANQFQPKYSAEAYLDVYKAIQGD